MQTNQETRRVAIYARHSGEGEASIQAQLTALRAHAEENGLEVEREYLDQQGSRAQFDEMMAEAAGEAPRSGRSSSTISVGSRAQRGNSRNIGRSWKRTA